MNKRTILVALAVLVAVAVTASAWAATTARVNLRTTSLGKILVNAHGQTLYLFALDKNGKSSCYGSCATYWPALVSTGKPAAGTGLKASLLGVTTRKDGKHQVTYNGHPLYTYVGDKAAGKTSGEGLNLSGGRWWVVSSAGNAVKNTSTSGGGGGGGGGYGGGGGGGGSGY